jgi:hypothetical protein
MPYSAGSTTVTRMAAAEAMAMAVERSSCFVEGSSARVGRSVLYMAGIPYETNQPVS